MSPVIIDSSMMSLLVLEGHAVLESRACCLFPLRFELVFRCIDDTIQHSIASYGVHRHWAGGCNTSLHPGGECHLDEQESRKRKFLVL